MRRLGERPDREMPLDHNSQEAADLLEATFANWDATGDGVISKAELTQVMVKLGMGKDHVDVLFKTMDLNSDGKVSFTEFVAFLYKGTDIAKSMDPRVAAKTASEAMDRIFDLLTDKKDEVKEVTEDDGEKLYSNKDLFEMMDLNGNGKVSISEFIQGLRSFQVDGKKPFTTHEFSDSVLHQVFKLLLKAKKKDFKDKALSYKSFKMFLAQEAQEVQ